MNIREVETLVGIKKTNIRYYEDEGLITPKRNAGNNYREYSPQDVEILRKIKQLRELDIPLADIREVISGRLSLTEAADRRLARLQNEKEHLQIIEDLCLKIRSEEMTFGTMDLSIDEEDGIWKEQERRITRTDRNPGYMESRIGSVIGYALMYAGMCGSTAGFGPGTEAKLFAILWFAAFFAAGVIITLRNDLYLLRKYKCRYLFADLLCIPLSAAVIQYARAVEFPVVAAQIPVLVYIVMSVIYKRGIC